MDRNRLDFVLNDRPRTVESSFISDELAKERKYNTIQSLKLCQWTLRNVCMYACAYMYVCMSLLHLPVWPLYVGKYVFVCYLQHSSFARILKLRKKP